MDGGPKPKSDLMAAIETYNAALEAVAMGRGILVQAESELVEAVRKFGGENIFETRVVAGNWLVVIEGEGDQAQLKLTKLDYVEP